MMMMMMMIGAMYRPLCGRIQEADKISLLIFFRPDREVEVGLRANEAAGVLLAAGDFSLRSNYPVSQRIFDVSNY